jgi:hypothetical protein
VGSVGWVGMTWMSERPENGTENKVLYDKSFLIIKFYYHLYIFLEARR